ncbi:glycosyltransferase family 9 protein [candidate division TA06 bacterium]|nr:glycosyltransferase family 9 protein [candidate division TA06 bacterium]
MVERSFNPERILVIRLRKMGDLLCATPVVTNLRRNFPNSTISFLVEERYKEVLEGNPDLDELISFDRSHSSLFQRILYEFRFLRKVRQKDFDLTVDLLGTLRTAILSLLSGAKQRVGFTYRVRKFFYNIRVEARNPQYVVDFNLDTLRTLGLKIETKELIFSLSEEAERFGKAFWKGHGTKKVVGLFPGGGWPAKRWSVEKFAELGERIEKELGYTILFLGGPQEKGVLSEISIRMAKKPWILEGIGLKELGAVLKGLNLLIGNDSGPINLAIALEVPTITLFGPTNPQNHNPPNGRHIALSRYVICRNPTAFVCDLPNCCIQSIQVEEVVEKVKEVLESNSGH